MDPTFRLREVLLQEPDGEVVECLANELQILVVVQTVVVSEQVKNGLGKRMEDLSESQLRGYQKVCRQFLHEVFGAVGAVENAHMHARRCGAETVC